MRALTSPLGASPVVLMMVGAFLVSACSYPHPGPTLPSDDGSAPAANTSSPVTPAAKPVTSSPVKPVISVSTPPSRSSAPTPVQTQPAPAAIAPPDSSSSAAGGGNAVPDAGLSFDNLDVTDSNLKGKLEILRVGSEPTPNNLLSVFVGMKNKTDQTLYLEVQTIYKDSTGNALNKGSWVPLKLGPHRETEYRSASISAQAVDFLVRIRAGSSDD